MAKPALTTKRVQIDKANVVVVATVAIAAFVTIFSLLAVKSLWSQRGYQAKVISAREKANDQLEQNIEAASKLSDSYQQFISSSTNAIGGNPSGSGERDGDNARIVLDALPSKYDFPALATSLEKLARERALTIDSIEGTDDELNQAANGESSNPVATEMPFKITVSGQYQTTQELVGVFERSIRPFVFNEMIISAASDKISLTIDGKSYYQAEKGLQLKSEVIK